MLNQARLESTGAMMTAQDQAYGGLLESSERSWTVAMVAGCATDT